MLTHYVIVLHCTKINVTPKKQIFERLFDIEYQHLNSQSWS